ncbi:alpha-D-glucose phosphate-specific phosphoglucomutase, partial [Natronospira sp.]
TGPYAREIFVHQLGLSEDVVRNGQPKPDFNGSHPDPNPHDAHAFLEAFQALPEGEIGAASDGDGDRNMILGRQNGRALVVSPCDSLAVIAANHHCIPALADGLKGVARSMPTSRALDRVAQELGIPCHETPTGWRFFASLLDGGYIRLCGEESFGTSSDHVREKDGLWAVLAWLQILASRDMTVAELLDEHWSRFGRDYFARHDFNLSIEQGQAVMERLSTLVEAGEYRDCPVDRFDYTDPVSGHRVEAQGYRLFTDNGRAVFRLSGTGTRGATLRIYLEQHMPAQEDCRQDMVTVLEPMRALASEAAQLEALTGKPRADQVI